MFDKKSGSPDAFIGIADLFFRKRYKCLNCLNMIR